VVEFGLYLGVPRENIHAVPIEYNQLSGNWWQRLDEQPNTAEKYLDFAEEVLTLSDGKADLVRKLLGDQPGRSLLVGDGVSDLIASRAVDLFVGFGGVVQRPRVVAEAPVYVHSPSLAPLLALAAGPMAVYRLGNSRYQAILEKAHHFIATGAITFKDEQLKTKFLEAWSASHKAVYSRPH
ncbi:MAG: hypothetical protein L0322_18640, partial [Chloroflexi bacterium]|nr:hypothetical protein [Chloroflexota bacterium]